MEIQNYDNNGNKIETPKSQKNQNNNNPTIIKRSRLDSLPVVNLADIEENKEKPKTQFQSSSNSKDNSFQTKLTKARSRYEIDNDTTFTVELGVMFTDEQVIVIPKEKFADADELGGGLYEKHWVKFRLWNFMESMTWKQECMDFLQVYRVFNLNVNKFNELKVRRLLLDWSFKDFGDDHKLFHINKQLTDESMELFFKRFNPIIVQYVINKMNEFLGE